MYAASASLRTPQLGATISSRRLRQMLPSIAHEIDVSPRTAPGLVRTTPDAQCAALLVSALTRTPRGSLCAFDVISAQDLRRFRDARVSSRRTVGGRFVAIRLRSFARGIERSPGRRGAAIESQAASNAPAKVRGTTTAQRITPYCPLRAGPKSRRFLAGGKHPMHRGASSNCPLHRGL